MTYEQILERVFQREPTLQPYNDPNFWAYKEAWEKVQSLTDGLSSYMTQTTWNILITNLLAHYIITTDYTFIDATGLEHQNPLYIKYSIANKRERGLVSSASDESSSASILTFESLNKGDFLMQDLLLTYYGSQAYQILEQLNVMPILL